MMKRTEKEKSQDKGDPELKWVYTPGTCPATGRRCLECGRPNHFARMCKGAANDRKDKWANTVECEQQTNTHGDLEKRSF